MKVFKVLFLTIIYCFISFQLETISANSNLTNVCDTELQSYSVWLIPEKRDLNYLQNIINNYSNVYNTPAFAPHITIRFDSTDDLNKVKSAIDEVCNYLSPIEVEVKDISASQNFFKTLFLTFKTNKKLDTLYNELTAKLDNNVNYEFNPHLSLLYKDMPLNEKLELTNEFNFDLKKIVFNNLYLIHEPDKTEIENWNPVYIKELTKS